MTWDKHLFMTREQIRKYDEVAIGELGIPGAVLMENAGRGAAEVASAMLEGDGSVCVLAGPGNNGGDGFVIARHLMNLGIEVVTLLAVERSKIKGDALINFSILEKMEPNIVDVSVAGKTKALKERLEKAGLIVDAILGTGVMRDIEGHMADIIEAVNRAHRPVLAIDVPSGLDADTGRPWGKAIKAGATVTFGHLKRGLVLYPGAEIAGKITVIPIGVPSAASFKAGFDGRVVAEKDVRRLIAKRNSDSHKGTFGHLLVVAGSQGKTGAASMTGKAAMRSGAGLVTIATSAIAQPVVEAKCEETMVESIIEQPDSPFTETVEKKIMQLLEGKQAVALGPGLTTAEGTSTMAIRLLQMLKVPAVVDADGINILAKSSYQPGSICAPLVLTPHPGEMARLVGKSILEVQADRINAAKEAATQCQAVVVLKGAHTVIAASDGQIFVNRTGNPGMASGGMGDVLTGIIGAFLAQKLTPLEAALIGVYVHGLAGDRIALGKGQLGLVASDVIEELPSIFREWGL